MTNVIFDSAAVKPAAPHFAFGLDSADWDRMAEDAMNLDRACGISTEDVPAAPSALDAALTRRPGLDEPGLEDRTWWAAHPANQTGYDVVGRRPAPATKPAPPSRTRVEDGGDLALPSNVKRVAIVNGKRRGEPLRKMGRMWVGIESGDLVAGDVVLRAYQSGRLAILPDVADEVDEDAMMMAYCEAEHERMEWSRMEAVGAC